MIVKVEFMLHLFIICLLTSFNLLTFPLKMAVRSLRFSGVRANEADLIRQKEIEIENGRLLVERASVGDAVGVKELLNGGVQPNAEAYNRTLYYQSKNYWSPLHHAAGSGHIEVVKMLIEDGGMFLWNLNVTVVEFR